MPEARCDPTGWWQRVSGTDRPSLIRLINHNDNCAAADLVISRGLAHHNSKHTLKRASSLHAYTEETEEKLTKPFQSGTKLIEISIMTRLAQ